MFEGLYRVQFQTTLGTGAGVVVLKGGQLSGGDTTMFYTGTYSQSGADFKAHITVGRHTPGEPSVFGIDDFSLELSGQGDGQVASLQGKSPQVPNIPFQATLKRLSNA